MNKRTKHPRNRGERMKLKAKKELEHTLKHSRRPNYKNIVVEETELKEASDELREQVSD